MTYNLTVSGNEITDPSRQAALAWALGQQGGSTDGLGLITNLCTNGGFESNTGGWGPYWSGVLTRVGVNPFLGSFCLQVDTVAGNTHTDGAQWAFPAGLPLGAYTLSMYIRMPVPTTLSFGIEGATVTDVLGRNVTPSTDWQRYTITCTVTAWNAGVSSNCKIKVIEQADTAITFFVDCVQLEFASTASNYVETNGAVGLGMQPGQGIAVWEAGTNLQRQGQCAALVDWQLLSGSTVTLDATTPAPFSPQSVKAACPGTISGEGVWAFTALGQAAPAGTVGVGSIWVKATAGTVLYSYVRWGLTDATTAQGTSVIWTATGNWQLITPPPVAVMAAKVGDQLGIFARTNVAAVASIWAAHAMLQSGPTVASPYIATSAGVTASRAAARVQAPSYLLDETQAWVALRVRLGFPSTGAPPINGLFSFADSNSTRLVAYIAGNGSMLFARQIAGVGGSVAPGVPPVYNAGDALTIICAWQAATEKISVNGVAFTSSANSSIPVLAAASFDIGSLDPYFAASELDGTILWLATGLGVLSDADAAALAALPGTPTAANFPAAAQLSSLMAMTTPTYAPIVDVSQNRRAQSNYSSLKALGYSDEMATAVASRIAA